jgi:hypothetical protein
LFYFKRKFFENDAGLEVQTLQKSVTMFSRSG